VRRLLRLLTIKRKPMKKIFKILLGITLAFVVIKVVLWQVPAVRHVVFGSTMDVQEVNFYGRVIDQNGNPVAGAIVPYELGGSALGGSNGAGRRITDINGEFQIAGRKGSSLLLKTVKHPDIEFGYSIPGDSSKTTYPDSKVDEMYVFGFQPDRGAHEVLWSDTSLENPYVFKAWRIDGSSGYVAKNLNIGEAILSFEYGKTYTLDFMKTRREISKEGKHDGQLRVIFQRESDDENITRRWEARIIPVDGGIQVTKDPYMNIAPEAGYEAEIHLVREKTGYDSIDNLPNQQYYFTANNGQVYGSLFVAFRANLRGKMKLFINYKINPDGERILVKAKEQ
jgi:hypothetical protein